MIGTVNDVLVAYFKTNESLYEYDWEKYYKFIRNCLKEDFLFGIFKPDRDEDELNLSTYFRQIIDSGMVWEQTKQGHNFWNKIQSEVGLVNYSPTLIQKLKSEEPKLFLKGKSYIFKSQPEDEGDEYVLEEDTSFFHVKDNEYQSVNQEGRYYFEANS